MTTWNDLKIKQVGASHPDVPGLHVDIGINIKLEVMLNALVGMVNNGTMTLDQYYDMLDGYDKVINAYRNIGTALK